MQQILLFPYRKIREKKAFNSRLEALKMIPTISFLGCLFMGKILEKIKKMKINICTQNVFLIKAKNDMKYIVLK